MNISGLQAAQKLTSSEKGAAQAIGTQKDQLNKAATDLSETRDTNAAGRAQKNEKNAQADFKAAKAAAQRDVNFAEQGNALNLINSGLTGAANLLKNLLG